MIVVVDASVVLKWLLKDPSAEQDTDRASELMRRVLAGDDEIVQPVHWLVEVASVLVRLSPNTAVDDIARLHSLELPTRDDIVVVRRAAQLAMELKQHVFDTLYHAVALETEGGLLITADDRYARSAVHHPAIVALSAWSAA